MHILFLTQVLPYPLDAGPKIRAYFVLRHLAQTHDVTLVSFVRPSDTYSSIDHLREFCSAVHTVPMVRSRSRDAMHLVNSLVRNRPFIVVRDWVPEMARLLTGLVDKAEPPFDAVHSDQLWMAPYALMVKDVASERHTPMTVLDQHNAVFMIPRRIANDERNPLKRALLDLESRKMIHYEAEMCQRFDRVVWVTPDDYAALQDRAEACGAPIPNDGVIPICVDPIGEAAIPLLADARRVTFLGGLHYPPNAQGVLWFCKQVFPLILSRVPDACLTVIGKLPEGGLGPLDVPSENLEVAGYVDDPKPYLAETAAYIVPLLAGGGMRVKIIDGWTWGMPIVSTSIGAEGIQYNDGEDLMIADAAQNFADAVVRLLTDTSQRNHLSAGGRRQIEQQYDWHCTYRAWNRIYPEM